MRFNSTTDSTLAPRNGQTVVVVRLITEPDEDFDAEVLPMTVVRFPDGFEVACWDDELEAS
jgi:hypothetical protein